METNITANQNSEWNLKRLAAQRQLYRDGKWLRLIRTGGTVLLAVGAPALLTFYPSATTGVVLIGALWVTIDFFARRQTDLVVRRAASIQECFDTELFRMPWNNIFVGTKPTSEQVVSAASRFKGDWEQLKNWYPDTQGIIYPLSVLFCQRMNLVWDWTLRRRYAFAVRGVVVAYLVGLATYAVYQELLVWEFLLGLVFPVISVIFTGIDTAGKHLKIADAKEETAKHVRGLWEAGIKRPRSVTVKQCREVQDCIYRDRGVSVLVPEWWYQLWRKWQEEEMHANATHLKSEAADASAASGTLKVDSMGRA